MAARRPVHLQKRKPANVALRNAVGGDMVREMKRGPRRTGMRIYVLGAVGEDF